jgi:hypothetical protein
LHDKKQQDLFGTSVTFAGHRLPTLVFRHFMNLVINSATDRHATACLHTTRNNKGETTKDFSPPVQTLAFLPSSFIAHLSMTFKP